jgi:anhydro-N-acetylmuramic acid kinase
LSEVHPVLQRFDIPVKDKLRTFVEHIADQVSSVIRLDGASTLLITGGGAFNSFLVERIHKQTQSVIVVPDPLTINFKEALIFAFLGVLRWRSEINCLKSCTGASHDNVGGGIYRVFSE